MPDALKKADEVLQQAVQGITDSVSYTHLDVYKRQVLVYVVVDEPHVEEQAHSTYASKIFQKIMTEICLLYTS